MISSEECKHHVRNGIGGIKAERHKILKLLMQMEESRKKGNSSRITGSIIGTIRAIKRLDGHVLRIEETIKMCKMVVKDEFDSTDREDTPS